MQQYIRSQLNNLSFANHEFRMDFAFRMDYGFRMGYGFRMASPPSGKEGWLKAGVVGAPIFTNAFTYHLPLRVLLLPEGGEAMQSTCETSVNNYQP